MTSGLETWNAEQSDQQVRADTHVAPGCPVSGPGPVRLAGETVGDDIACVGFGPRLPKLLDASGADAIVVVGGLADLGEREIDRKWRHLGDPVFDDWLGDRYDDLADRLAGQDVPVLWATYPHVRLAPGNDGEGDWTTVADNDPLRVERLNEIIHDTVSGRDDFSVIDLDAWTQDLPAGRRLRRRVPARGPRPHRGGRGRRRALARAQGPRGHRAPNRPPPTRSGDATTSTTAGEGGAPGGRRRGHEQRAAPTLRRPTGERLAPFVRCLPAADRSPSPRADPVAPPRDRAPCWGRPMATFILRLDDPGEAAPAPRLAVKDLLDVAGTPTTAGSAVVAAT